ncbi:MnhB domain-containing protein [Amaricoccus sp.]|uniref:MnhB domain-containing protein n=1 Tax=Amaricoccus sp. TaxID=1872485 RepID=UPI001B63B3CF|nr:MnhB domain-containing protein [Amaricoccus sp.]MBP7242287.1 Na(+)/H(+) antiporter subunit B [Amaricoccus sp.]
MKSVILSAATRMLVPAILALSVFVFWRGHNEPGGGFVGGLLAAAAIALLEKAEGRARAARALRFDPQSIAAVGLGCAVTAGLWGGLARGTFLKGMWPFYDIGLPFGSIFLFDLGVYLVVLGTIAAILFALEDAVSTDADPGSGGD